jgi:hypothetical protein
MSLVSEIKELKRWKQSRPPVSGVAENRLVFAKALYRDHPGAWTRFEAEPARAWMDCVIDFNLLRLLELSTIRGPHLRRIESWEQHTRIVYVAPWQIGPDDVPPLNLRRDRLGHTIALAQFLNGDQADKGDQWRGFSEQILVDGHWPMRWFDAWLAVQAHGEGL